MSDLQAPIVNENGDLACPECGCATFARFATEKVVDKAWGRPGGWIDTKNVDADGVEERWECWECEVALSSPYDVESVDTGTRTPLDVAITQFGFDRAELEAEIEADSTT